MEEKEVFYIYRHLRKDSGEPFYIGLGKVYNPKAKSHEKYYSRAFQKTKRNRFWNFIVEKTEYEVEIIFEANDRQTIIEKEIEFITLYGRRDLGKGTLVNMSDGGDGMNNNIQSEETLEKRRKMYAEGKTGLKPLRGADSPRAVKVVEISTNKIFTSLTEAAEHLGISVSVFSANLNHSNNQSNKTGFKFFDETLNKDHIVKKRHRKVYDYDTEQIIESTSEASRIYKKDHKTIRGYLNGKYKNKTSLVYYEDYLNGIRPDDLYISKKNKEVINIDTKEIYDSMLKASIVAGVTKSLFANKMKGIRPNDTPYMLLSDYNDNLQPI